MEKFFIKKFLIIVCALLLSYGVLGQTIRGTVTASEGETLPGVAISIKGTAVGTITDLNGQYTFEMVSEQDILVFSYIGRETKEVLIGTQTKIDVVLEPDESELDEVVIIGYGKTVTRDLTSSITTIKSKELEQTPTGQAMQALQGKVAGLQVVSSGAPGNSPTIRVRGVGSFPDKGDESPLYVVDGMFFDNIDFLNTAEIATISVLKDASAAAIYGVRAAHGVVLIETKSGAYNKKTEISYDGYYGVQMAQNILKMANAEQFTNMALESGSVADAEYILNAMQRYGRSRVNPNVPDVNTDWYNEILRPAPIQNHSFIVSGGSENAAFSVGANYFAQEGIQKMKNDYERFNLRTKLDYKATNWLTIGGNMIWSNALKHDAENPAWGEAYFAVPIMPVYDELNTTAWPKNYASAEHIGFRGGKNPQLALDQNDHELKIRKLLTNFHLQIDFIPEKLFFKTSYNYSLTGLNKRDIGLPYVISTNFQRPNSEITKTAETYSNQLWNNVLTYSNAFDKHNLTIMAGTEFREDTWSKLTAKGLNFPYDTEEAWYLDKAETIELDAVTDDGRREYGLSYFSRIAYNFDNRYLLYGTVRADGTSKFQEKWTYLPTVGIGWVLSEESFMENIDLINFLKFRTSWGKLANDKVDASVGSNVANIITTAVNDQLVTGLLYTNTFDYLNPEVTEEWNFGLTASFFQDRLSLDADYFIRNTINAVIPVKLGADFVRRNAGEIKNSGFEVAIGWSDKFENGLSYHINSYFSTLKNEAVDLYGQPYIDGGIAEFRQRTIVGEPLLAFYGYEVLGVYQNDAEVQADPTTNLDAGSEPIVPGDFKYKDQNGDGVINGDDRVVLGSYIPTFFYGANIGLAWRNFELSASIMGQTGNKILNRKRGQVIWTNDGNMDADLAINRWHGEGTSNKYPSSEGLRKGWNQKMSTYFVEDGSFFRIQNVQLAYNIKGKELFGVEIPHIRASLTAERPLTVFKYNGFNPEVENGIDTETYPIPAVYTFGLNIKF